MQTIVVRSLSFSSFAKILMLTAFSIGAIIAVLCPIAMLFGLDVATFLPSFGIRSMIALLVNFFLYPIFLAAAALIFSLIAYIPFRVGLFIFVRLHLKGEFEKA